MASQRVPFTTRHDAAEKVYSALGCQDAVKFLMGTEIPKQMRATRWERLRSYLKLTPHRIWWKIGERYGWTPDEDDD